MKRDCSEQKDKLSHMQSQFNSIIDDLVKGGATNREAVKEFASKEVDQPKKVESNKDGPML